MKRAVILLVVLSGSYSLNAQETEIQYLSVLDKDHTVQWDFFINNGMNSGKWSKIGVPSNWELQGLGSYLYGGFYSRERKYKNCQCSGTDSRR